MNIQTVGLISEYIKGKRFEMKWQERKANSFTPKDDGDSIISLMRKQHEDMNRAVRLQRIEGKLKAGERLSGPDMEYLRVNSPDMYEKALKIENERKEYRRALERSKTKEEAQALHMSRTQQFLVEAKAVSNNPNIPEDKKKELLTEIAMRAAAIFNEYVDFSKSEKYRELPSENDESPEDFLPGKAELEQLFQLKDASEKDTSAKDSSVTESAPPPIPEGKPRAEERLGYLYNSKGEVETGIDLDDVKETLKNKKASKA